MVAIALLFLVGNRVQAANNTATIDLRRIN